MTKISMKLVMSAAALLAMAAVANAQQQPQPQSPQNPTCARLESQLQAFDRGSADAARADQVRKYEEAEANQQAEIERQEATARRMGCEQNSFFVLFSGQSAQCTPVKNKIQQMRANLEQIQSQLERLRGDSEPDVRGGQRRAILVALAQNNCGAQYQQAVAASPPRGGILESLFGSRSPVATPDQQQQPGFSPASGTYRTICVRTCDGYYYPISYAASPARFAEDEKACRQSCPAAEVSLYMYRNPGETVEQAISLNGAPYSALPTAYRYRQTVDPNCSCRHAGESWSQALKNVDDTNVEQGDIVVNEQNARTLSQPRIDAKGKPIKPEPRAVTRPDPKAPPAAAPAAAPETAAKEAPDKPDPNRTVRTVGPTFLAPKTPANN
jgi:uncharacterized protein DUF2865